MSSYSERIIRALKLDASLYEEVEADQTAMGQALGVVVMGAVASSIGYARGLDAGHMVMGVIDGILGWVVWAYIIYFVGTRIIKRAETRTDPGELMRTLGFASAPFLIMVLGIVPGLRGIAGLVATLWMFAAMIVAVRQALDYTGTGPAILVCGIGLVVRLAVYVVLALVFGVF